jgi:hypothetical protein
MTGERNGPGPAFQSAEVDALLVALEEATRATPTGGPVEFVPPAGGELQQAQARFHHFIFGRRGSGKTSLLRYLEAELVREHRVTVWIDQELFMALSFPDVLVSSVLELMEGARAASRPTGHRAQLVASVSWSGTSRADDLRVVGSRDYESSDPQAPSQ